MTPHALAFTLFRFVAVLLLLAAVAPLLALLFMPPTIRDMSAMAGMEQMMAQAVKMRAMLLGVPGILLFFGAGRLAKLCASGYKADPGL